MIEVLELDIQLPKTLTGTSLLVEFDKVTDFLGSGAYGEVFKVIDTNNDVYALKVIQVPVNSDKGKLRQIEQSSMRELFASSRVHHHNTCKIYNFGYVEWNGHTYPYLLSEFIKGKELKDVLISGCFSEIEKFKLLYQIALGLQAIHTSKIVHRDLSSRNIMVTEENIAKIIDFGISYFIDITQTTLRLTLTERLTDPNKSKARGNPPYMAPELWAPNIYEDLDCGLEYDELYGLYKPMPQSDIFAFGVLCYELMTHRLPFHYSGLDYGVVRAAILNDQVSWPSGLGIHNGLKIEIESCLQKNPKMRPAIDELVEFLKSLCNDDLDLVHTTTTLQNITFAEQQQLKNSTEIKLENYLVEILKSLWNNGYPRELSINQISRYCGAGAYGNHRKLSHEPWDLVEDSPSKLRRLTDRGRNFVQGSLKVPQVILKNKESGKFYTPDNPVLVDIHDY